jgi:putative methyltransferase (TIGR04325 family)
MVSPPSGFERLKRAAKSLSPPILLDLARKLKPDYSAREFEGPFASWKEAEARSDGWDSPEITAKTLEVSLKVRDGIAAFQQDTIVYDKIDYSATILAFLLLALSRHPDNLSIVDFGGSLGTNYFQNRKILERLSVESLTWNIVERPDIVKLGNQHFAGSTLRFFAGLDEAIESLGGRADSFLFSGSLQYVEEPFSLLDEAIDSGARVVAFDRLLVSAAHRHAVFIQRPDPGEYYRATYPAWRFSRDLFVREIASKGFSLVEHFPLDVHPRFDYCGMLFVRTPSA